MTDTLPSSPSPDTGVKRAQKPNLKIAQFGDGYSQRAKFGLNQVAMELTLTYTNIVTAEKDILETFVDAHDSGQAFFYTLPDESEARTFYFTGWEYTYVKFGIYTVTLNLTECFDIV